MQNWEGNRQDSDQVYRAVTKCLYYETSIIEQSIEWQSSLYLTFVDFWEGLRLCTSGKFMEKLLRLQSLPLKIINTIRVLHERFQWSVMVNNGQTEWFPVTSELKQGCMLSPLLYLVAMDWVM